MARSSGQYRRLLEFQTHADSGAMPGAALTMGAGRRRQRGEGISVGVEAMAGRSADRAVEYLSKFFADQGWISPDKVRTPMLP